MTSYIVRNGVREIDPRPYDPKAPITSVPYVIGDIPDYVSPASGKVISGRVQRREDLARTGCVPYERGPNSPAPGYRNPSFALKRGLPLTEP